MPKPGNVPACPGAPAARSAGRITKEYRISLVTPLFGGGVEPGQPDETFPIRATSIRGHLRYWWRVMVGCELGGGMWQREEEIFGSTNFPSPLSVRVIERPQIQCVDPTYGEKFGPVAYALFPAVENRQQVVKEGVAFRLEVTWHDVDGLQSLRRVQNACRKRNGEPLLPDTIEDIGADITLALEAWCAFGGLGARTRRGCGAVFCEMLATRLPPFPGTILVGQSQTNALAAWKESVKAYRDFRQSPRGRKHQKTIGFKTVTVPGRSHWPEADSIRTISGSALRGAPHIGSTGVPADEDTQDHSVPVVPEALLPAFPRAILGLPINFHFADSPGKDRPGQPNRDPQDTQLLPVLPKMEADRMSSPVITRPLWLAGGWCPAVMILKQTIADGLRLRIVGKRARADGTDLSHDLSLERVINPSLAVLRPMRGHASALDALCDFLRFNGFREIGR